MSTRLAQAGFELNTIAEFPAEITENLTTSTFSISSTKAKTGTFAGRFQNQSSARGVLLPTNPTQLRGGFYINHNALASTSSLANILRIINTSGGVAMLVRWGGTAASPSVSVNSIDLVINGTIVASVAPSVFSTTNVWYHIGFTWKQHASTGYCTIYLDGVAILTFTGNTGSLAAAAFYVGGASNASASGFASSMYIDDFYVDDDSGGTDLAPNSPRFLWSLANAAGHLAQFTPLSSTNISNVDDTDASAPDDDSTYNFAQSAGLTDEFNTTNITVPAGYSIVAAIPVAYAKKTNAGVASTIELVAYDGSLTTTGSPKTPTTAYSVIWDRFTTQPDGTIWDETDFNACQFGYTSSGSY
jgi:hypothetical protein